MRATALACLAVLVTSAAPAFDTEEAGVAGAAEAVAAVHAAVQVERELLDEALAQYRSASRRRVEALARLAESNQALDAAVSDPTSVETGRLDQLVDQVRRSASECGALFEAERVHVMRVRDGRRRLALLEGQLSALAARLIAPDEEGLLTGRWELVLMPLGQRGTARLRQEGAIISGTYELAGGWTGSLQGTLVERKVLLQRIDSKLGRMMEFEGYLSRDAQAIRGTWLNFELAGGGGSTGQFAFERLPQAD